MEKSNCPFCGGEGVLDFFVDCTKVYCKECGAEGPPVDVGEKGNHFEKAVKLWNERK